ncbi:hypothetical protein Sinac_4227 [Singulisphaera acidiphila DSM 18658]|uniref:Uncharacterized protein n=1 Tax=Singulisphaera acidiphila (strain ATCC BAA-1392 / DSM 18658 / VKM B-2454 / MOB10) TaxID=886293 RepID=L0DHV9_SINAD|nr:hypothetical protein Sinac_4227 [Singulisphaera acidiphila DSM 18658]
MKHAQSCFTILSLMIVGCWDPSNDWPEPSTGVPSTVVDRSRLPGTTAKANSMISKSEAVAIARKYIRGRVNLQKGAPIEVGMSDKIYTV